jgi:hypothetical protein
MIIFASIFVKETIWAGGRAFLPVSENLKVDTLSFKTGHLSTQHF